MILTDARRPVSYLQQKRVLRESPEPCPAGAGIGGGAAVRPNGDYGR